MNAIIWVCITQTIEISNKTIKYTTINNLIIICINIVMINAKKIKNYL
jgi:hypothetical protein